jgi:DNA-binding transcriptional ArsR family regulator
MALDLDTAALLLDELGNQTRLRIVRLLVRAGDEGRTVGDIEGTVLHCFVDFKMISELVSFLTAECCVDTSTSTSRRRAAG